MSPRGLLAFHRGLIAILDDLHEKIGYELQPFPVTWDDLSARMRGFQRFDWYPMF